MASYQDGMCELLVTIVAVAVVAVMLVVVVLIVLVVLVITSYSIHYTKLYEKRPLTKTAGVPRTPASRASTISFWIFICNAGSILSF